MVSPLNIFAVFGIRTTIDSKEYLDVDNWVTLAKLSSTGPNIEIALACY